MLCRRTTVLLARPVAHHVTRRRWESSVPPKASAVADSQWRMLRRMLRKLRQRPCGHGDINESAIRRDLQAMVEQGENDQLHPQVLEKEQDKGALQDSLRPNRKADDQPHKISAESQWRMLRRKLRHLQEHQIAADEPAIQQHLRNTFDRSCASQIMLFDQDLLDQQQQRLSNAELEKEDEGEESDRLRGALQCIAQEKRDVANAKAKLEAELEAARKVSAQLQQQLDALKAAESRASTGRGVRKPQDRRKFQVLAMDKTYVWHQMLNHTTMGKASPPLMVEGFGNRVWDANGKEYLDAASGGTWTVNVGYGRTEIADAVRQQLATLHYYALTAANIPSALFAEKLISKMPGMGRVYYSSSGSEANEKAYKMVRQISQFKHGGKKNKILYRERDYHGTTITALSSSGQEERKEGYGPFTPGFVAVPHCCEYRAQWASDASYPYGVRAADEVERVILQEGPETCGAIIIESITAGGGVIPPPQGYMERLQAICKKYALLIIVDEVVMGLGRTGAWFGYQHYGLVPDIVTMAKGVASGYAAISCTVTSEAVFEMLEGSGAAASKSYFRDVSTFGACTGGQAAALANINIIEREKLVTNSRVVGLHLEKRLRELQQKHLLIGDVRGKGLFQGIELVTNRASKEPVREALVTTIAADCMEQGVLVGRTNRCFDKFNNNVLISPPLISTEEDIDIIVHAIDKSLERATARIAAGRLY